MFLNDTTPKSSVTQQYFIFGAKNQAENIPELPLSFLPKPKEIPTNRISTNEVQ